MSNDYQMMVSRGESTVSALTALMKQLEEFLNKRYTVVGSHSVVKDWDNKYTASIWVMKEDEGY